MSEIETRLPRTELLFEDVFQYPVPELLAQHLYRKKAKVDKEEKIRWRSFPIRDFRNC